MAKRIDTGTAGTLDIRRIRVTLKGTVAAKDIVALDVSQSGPTRFVSAIKAAAVATIGNPWAGGVALQAGVTGDVIEVQVYGYVADVAAGGCTAVDPVCVIGTAGTAVPFVAACTCPILAICVTTTSGGLSDLFLLDPLKLAA